MGDLDYLAKLTKLIADLRTDLGVADLPFIAGQIANSSLLRPTGHR